MTAVAIMSLDDRVLHVPGPAHGQALCGVAMRDPWLAGPLAVVDERSRSWCEWCFDDVVDTL
jgi:hypothetical protein